MNRVVHFEIHAADPERAAGFYRDLFGWTLALGGTLALPKMPIEGVGWLAYCKDTAGNLVGMLRDDKAVA